MNARATRHAALQGGGAGLGALQGLDGAWARAARRLLAVLVGLLKRRWLIPSDAMKRLFFFRYFVQSFGCLTVHRPTVTFHLSEWNGRFRAPLQQADKHRRRRHAAAPMRRPGWHGPRACTALEGGMPCRASVAGRPMRNVPRAPALLEYRAYEHDRRGAAILSRLAWGDTVVGCDGGHGTGMAPGT